MTDDQFASLTGRLDRIEANQKLTVEGLRLVCQELGIRERLTAIVEQLNGNGHVPRIRDTDPAPPPEGAHQ